jgi:tripartite-type tricarboxylate transporter receptor subunit TctC
MAAGRHISHTIRLRENAVSRTPAPVVDRLHRELKAILASDKTKKKLFNARAEPDYMGPAEFDA